VTVVLSCTAPALLARGLKRLPVLNLHLPSEVTSSAAAGRLKLVV
jgi:hypothetical protein